MLVLLLVFLVPVALYCLVLAGINRGRPIMVSGIADLIGLLFALSGFLFLVGPEILRGFFERAMESIPLDTESKEYDDLLWNVGIAWQAIWVAYYGILIVGIGVAFWLQRNKTSIYNIDLLSFERAFSQTLTRLGLKAQRSGKAYLLTTADYEPSAVGDDQHGGSNLAAREATLEFEYFPALCHLTLRWNGDAGPLREEAEAGLVSALSEADTPDNPAALWFLGVGGSLIGMIFVILVLLMLMLYLTR